MVGDGGLSGLFEGKIGKAADGDALGFAMNALLEEKDLGSTKNLYAKPAKIAISDELGVAGLRGQGAKIGYGQIGFHGVASRAKRKRGE